MVHALRVAQRSRAQVFIASPAGQAEYGAVPGTDVVSCMSRCSVLQRLRFLNSFNDEDIHRNIYGSRIKHTKRCFNNFQTMVFYRHVFLTASSLAVAIFE